MDDFKKKQLQEFFTLLEDDSVSCQIDEDEECVLVDFPNEMDTSSYDVDDFLDYMSDIKTLKRVNNSTVSTKHVRQIIIDTNRHGSPYILSKLEELSYTGPNYAIQVVSEPFLVGLQNSRDNYYDDNYGLFPCSTYWALELRYSDNNRLNKQDEIKLVERVLFDLTRRVGIAVYVSEVIDVDEFIGYADEDDAVIYADTEEVSTDMEIDIDAIPKHTELLNMYREAKEAMNPSIAFLHYYKMIEYVSPAVAKKNAFDQFHEHLSLPDTTLRDYHYMATLLDIAKGYRDNQKDDFLAISVIQTCIDVVPDFYHLPQTLQKTVKHQLGIEEKVKIESIALSNEQQMSLKKQVANILYSTRNSIVHAKSNYEPNGLECPPDSLEEVNQMMSSIGRALIQWNENQADYIWV